VIGESQSTAVLIHLAPLGNPLSRCLDHFETSHEDVIDRVGRGRGDQAEALAQLGEDLWVLLGSQVEVAAEDQRRVARPVASGLRGAQHVLARQLGAVVGRVQVGDAELGAIAAGRDAREGHRPPLGPPFVNRQIAPLDDLTASHQGEVRAALAGGDQVGVEAGGDGAHGAERVA
jgi:hypothetical protein